jgi:uncharacterized iron-regulated membrane protein
MTRGQKQSLVRRTHSWLGVIAALVLLVVAGSGILLQHPAWVGEAEDEVLCLAADPVTPARLLRGMAWGVEVSDDGGARWREAPMLAPPSNVARILFGPGAGVVYAMGAQSLVMSTDGGRIWQELPGPHDERLLSARFVDLTVSSEGTLELLTTAGQYRRTDNGAWQAVGTPNAPQRGGRRWVHDLHTGHLFGGWGRRVVEGGAWGLVLLTVSGLVLRRRSGARKSR